MRRHWSTRASALTTALEYLKDPAREHRPVGLEALPGHLKTERVEPAERGQVRAGECSVAHVEVFLAGLVEEPPSSEGLDAFSRTDTPASCRGDDTLICEEPDSAGNNPRKRWFRPSFDQGSTDLVRLRISRRCSTP